MPRNRLNPHDRFARAMMTNRKVVREFFDVHLPKNIKNILDFSSIQPQKDSFIDDKLRLRIADLLYEVEFNGETGFIYILLEHASTPDKLLPFRMLKYMTAIMDHHLKKTQSQKLPFIYPMILYSGDKPYPYSMDLWDLFGSEKELVKQTMMQPYSLIDLTQVSDEELKKYLWFGTMSLMLKHAHDPDILPFFKSFLDVLRKLESQDESDYIYTIISYVVEAGEVSDKAEFLQTIKKLESINEEKVMTIVEQLKPEIYKRGIEKGRVEGKQEGKREGKQEGKREASHTIAINLLSLGLPQEKISQATGLSLPELEGLKKQLH